MARFHQPPSGETQPPAKVPVAQEPDDRVGEVGGVVGAEEVLARDQREALGAHRGRDDRLAHGEGLEDLEARPSAHPQRHDAHGRAREVDRLRRRYPARLEAVPRLVATSPNTEEVRDFLQRLRPDLLIARCKFILKPEIFTIPGAGTFVLHPGICPEYRNAHGCFWALVNRDLDRVGMTLLRVDAGVDTGPIYLQATYPFNEVEESHRVIQYRVVLDNLEAIAATLRSAWNGHASPIRTEGRRSATWGQPWLTAYLRWKAAARRTRANAPGDAALSRRP